MKHLIIGNGYLGQRLGNRLADGSFWYTNRSAVNTAHAGGTGLALDINDPASWENLATLSGCQALVVYMMIPPGRINIELLPQFLQQLDKLPIDRRILTSSTVVYGQEERVVDADSNVLLDSERAERQFAVEQAWLNDAKHACVLRLAGLYGPGRIIGLHAVRSGQPVSGDADGWLNLIHIDDAAELLIKMAGLEQAASYELGSDGTPLKRRDYYGLVAELSRSPAPSFKSGPAAKPGRRCNNQLTIARTGWQPLHADIRNALALLLEET